MRSATANAVCHERGAAAITVVPSTRTPGMVRQNSSSTRGGGNGRRLRRLRANAALIRLTVIRGQTARILPIMFGSP